MVAASPRPQAPGPAPQSPARPGAGGGSVTGVQFPLEVPGRR